MKARTEEDILSKAPLLVKFGDEEYKIKPLTILKAREWRANISPVIAKALGQDAAMATPERIKAAIQESPEDMVEIVVSYSGLDKDKILEVTTEEQMLYAYNLVMGVAFSPFLTQQSVMKMVMDPELLASVRSTKVH